MPITNTTVNPRVLFNPPFNSNTFTIVQWADLPTNLDVSPVTGDLMKVINAAAINISIESIINTYIGERPYSTMGTALQLRLFENSNDLEQEMIRSAVFLSLAQYEPRINVQSVVIVVSADENSYQMTITYNIINTSQVQTLTIILQRNR
jgi:phage baseplate assembly protein W